jgi:hypothetical protein
VVKAPRGWRLGVFAWSFVRCRHRCHGSSCYLCLH